MSGVEIRQRAASERERGGRRRQEGWPLYRASSAGALYLQTCISSLCIRKV